MAIFNTPQEPQVDCSNCRVNSPTQRIYQHEDSLKCCDFQPFVNAFTLGKFLHEDPSFLSNIPDHINMVFLKIGMVPNIEYRSLHNKYRQESHKYNANEFKCSFYDLKSRLCKIWQYRPPICRYYFCASSGGIKKLNEYQNMQASLEQFEALELKKWFLESNTLVSWEILISYLDLNAPNHLENKVIKLSVSEASDYYLKSYDWYMALDL